MKKNTLLQMQYYQNKTNKADFVIEGSVEKNIDMTLDKCIELALGNNLK